MITLHTVSQSIACNCEWQCMPWARIQWGMPSPLCPAPCPPMTWPLLAAAPAGGARGRHVARARAAGGDSPRLQARPADGVRRSARVLGLRRTRRTPVRACLVDPASAGVCDFRAGAPTQPPTRRSFNPPLPPHPGLYPAASDDYEGLAAAIERLTLNDASVTVKKESSDALGAGFRWAGGAGLGWVVLPHRKCTLILAVILASWSEFLTRPWYLGLAQSLPLGPTQPPRVRLCSPAPQVRLPGPAALRGVFAAPGAGARRRRRQHAADGAVRAGGGGAGGAAAAGERGGVPAGGQGGGSL